MAAVRAPDDLAVRIHRPGISRDSAARPVVPDETGDHGAEPLAGVLLQEMAGSLDHWVLDARRARHGALEYGRHAAGDGVPVAERHEERLVPLRQPAPGCPVGLSGGII